MISPPLKACTSNYSKTSVQSPIKNHKRSSSRKHEPQRGSHYEPTPIMFCNEMEHALFSPIPPSLWTDDYSDQDGTALFVLDGVMRNRPSSSQQRRRLLPPLHHFRSLPQTYETDTTELMDECDSIDGSSMYSRTSSNSLTSSPSRNESEKTVKSLFNDGCLFAYSPQKERGGTISQFKKSKTKGKELNKGKQPRLNMNGLRRTKGL